MEVRGKRLAQLLTASLTPLIPDSRLLTPGFLRPRRNTIFWPITAGARHASSVGIGGRGFARDPLSCSVPRGVPREGGGSSVVEVKLDDVDRIEWALKTFKKKVQRAGVLQDLRRKRHYVKPSEARQQKAAAARRRKRSRG